MIVWIMKSESPEAGREGDTIPSVYRTKAEAVRIAKMHFLADHEICIEIVKVTFPKGNKDQFVKVLKQVIENHDTGTHLNNYTPGPIEFKEIK